MTMITSECGPLAKNQCSHLDEIEKEYLETKVFLDIPYENYDDCEKVLRETLAELHTNHAERAFFLHLQR